MSIISARTGAKGPRESLLSRGGAMIVMGVCTIYFLTPIWWLLVSATKTKAELTRGQPLWFSDFKLFENIQGALSYGGGIFGRWMLNSVLYAGGGALIATLLAGMCGYALAKYPFRGRGTPKPHDSWRDLEDPC